MRRDPEIEALGLVIKATADLNPEAMERVFNYCRERNKSMATGDSVAPVARKPRRDRGIKRSPPETKFTASCGDVFNDLNVSPKSLEDASVREGEVSGAQTASNPSSTTENVIPFDEIPPFLDRRKKK